MYCENHHSTNSCDQLRWKPHEERKAFVFQNRLCFGCLQPGHIARSCKARLTCDICGYRHATMLHRVQRSSNPSSSEAPPVSPNVVSAGVGLKSHSGNFTMMPVVPVRLMGKSGKEVLTNAFLDQGSSGCFITSHLASRLGLDEVQVNITIDTVANEGQEVKSAVVEGARVGPIGSDELFALPQLFTLNQIPISVQDKCRSEDMKLWPHLNDVLVRKLDAPVELMIGSNAANLLVSQETRSPEDVRGPFGVRTCLGWYVLGPSQVGEGADPRCLVNFLRISKARICPDDSMGDRGSRVPWLEGPEFLSQGKETWPGEPLVSDAMPETEVNASPVCPVNVTASQIDPSETLVTRYSSFDRLKKAVAWYHRLSEVVRSGDFKRFCLARRKGLRPRKARWRVGLEMPDLEKAERAILRYVQTGMPDLPVDPLTDGPVEVKRDSQLENLRPTMKNGLLVVGAAWAPRNPVGEVSGSV